MTSQLEFACGEEKSFRSKAIDAILQAGPGPPLSRAERACREQRAAQAQEAAKDSYEMCALLVGMVAVKQAEFGRFPELSEDQRRKLGQSVQWLRPENFDAIDRMVLDSIEALRVEK